MNPVSSVESDGPARGAARPFDVPAVGLTAQAVEHWLLAHPDFFVERPQALESLVLHDPRGMNTVSLIERQVAQLRERHRVMERRLEELLEIGSHNHSVDRRLWELATRLLATGDLRKVPSLLIEALKKSFAVPLVALTVWAVDSSRMLIDSSTTDASEPDGVSRPGPARRSRRVASSGQRLGKVANEALVRLAQASNPYCGPFSLEPAHRSPGDLAAAVRQLPGMGREVASVAVVALQCGGGGRGLLILGSPDLERFQVGMGTEFLQLLGSMAGAALGRLVDHEPSQG